MSKYAIELARMVSSCIIKSRRDPRVVADIVTRVASLSRSLRRLNELACNQELTHRQETRGENIEREIQRQAESIGMLAYFQGDPRGCAVYLYTQSELDEYNRIRGENGGKPPSIDSVYSSIGIAIY